MYLTTLMESKNCKASSVSLLFPATSVAEKEQFWGVQKYNMHHIPLQCCSSCFRGLGSASLSTCGNTGTHQPQLDPHQCFRAQCSLPQVRLAGCTKSQRHSKLLSATKHFIPCLLLAGRFALKVLMTTISTNKAASSPCTFIFSCVNCT